MNNTLKYLLVAVIVLALGAGLVYTGIWIGRFGVNPFAGRWDSPGWGMMGGSGWDSCPGAGSARGWGMMGEYSGGGCPGADSARGWGMMGGSGRSSCPGAGFSWGCGALDGFPSAGEAVQPLDIHQVEGILEAYLEDTGDPDLAIAEIMVFDNHAYAELIETSTGIGAMEVLVDYQTQGVYPEHGPNMMWNLKYSPMAGRGPGMMGSGPGGSASGADLEEFGEMPVSPQEAVESAQAYLDSYQPGFQADHHADVFYGYYTLHVLEGGEVVGMLSVNGYSGQVFYHDWHGELLEMTEHDDDH